MGQSKCIYVSGLMCNRVHVECNLPYRWEFCALLQCTVLLYVKRLLCQGNEEEAVRSGAMYSAPVIQILV